jgi:hypothetical protein
MKSQATKYTPRQMAYLEYWEARGYRFSPGEMPPESTVTPPSLATRRPILDAVLGSLTLAAIMGAMVLVWIKAGAGI